MPSNRLILSRDSIAQHRNKPQLVSFLSGKGGVGKSTIAFNLAAVMARQGEKCLVIDTDWYFGNLHLLANVVPEGTLADLLEEKAFIGRSISRIETNLHLIASPSASATECEFYSPSFARLLAKIRNIFHEYDFVIIDTPSGLIDLINLAANASDINLVILNPELTSISDAYGLFKYLVRSNNKISVHFLINQLQNSTEHEYIYRKLAVMAERFLGRLPYDGGYLLSDKAVIESVALQRSLIDLSPDNPVIGGLMMLRKLLVNETADQIRIDETINQEKIISERPLADIKG